MSDTACVQCGARNSMIDGGCARCGFGEAVVLPDPMTVTGRLRWEHNKLYLGHVHIGNVHQFGRNADYMTAARAALVEAVKKAIGG